MREEITDCSGADCIAVADIGNDWFRIRSTVWPHVVVAVTGEELRAFLRQVRAGQFDELARLERDTTVDELLTERDALLARITELELGSAA